MITINDRTHHLVYRQISSNVADPIFRSADPDSLDWVIRNSILNSVENLVNSSIEDFIGNRIGDSIWKSIRQLNGK